MRKFIVAGNVRKKNVAVLAVIMAMTLSACSPVETKTAENSVEQSRPIDTMEKPEETLTLETTGELSEDALEVKNITEVFYTAYFDRNIDEIKKYLASSYEDDIRVLDSTEEVSDISIRGLAKIKEAKIGDRYTVYCEFKPNAQSDTFQYLTIEFIKQEDGWKVEAYGLEL